MGEQKKEGPAALRGLRWEEAPTGVRFARTGTGPPLLLLPGMGAGPEAFAPLLAHLQSHWTLVLPQLPSPGPQATWEEVVARLAPLLEPEGAHLLGTSYGGLLALGLALQHPEGVRRLVVVAALPRLVRAAWLRRELGRLRADPAGFAAAMVRDSVGRPYRAARPRTVQALVEAYRANLDPERLEREAAVSLQADLWPAVGRIRAPTLVVVGGEDPWVPLAEARRLAAALPAGELYVVPQAGHLVLVEAHAQVLPVIRRFLRAAG